MTCAGFRAPGSRGTDSPGDHQDFSNPMITCRSVPLPATTRRRLYCRSVLGEFGPTVGGGEGELKAQGGARFGRAVEKDPAAECLDAVLEAE